MKPRPTVLVDSLPFFPNEGDVMNRFLVFPLIGSLAVFAVVLRSHADKVLSTSTAAPSGYFARSHDGPLLERDLMPLEDAERHILESWPTIDQNEVFSRRGPHAIVLHDPRPFRKPTIRSVIAQLSVFVLCPRQSNYVRTKHKGVI